MANIHPSAIVDPSAIISTDVTIGAFSIIGANVSIGPGTTVSSHCVVSGYTTIGNNNFFHPYCAIGCDPQDKKYNNEPTRLIIGDNNTFFHNVTISTGTSQDQSLTSLGNNNWIMAYAHVAHDCVIGSNVIMANCATLAGHVTIGDYAILGGLTAVHQFCTIGDHAMAGGGSIIVQDLPPFVMCEGNRAIARGFNSEGMKRRGFTEAEIKSVKNAYRLLYRSGLAYDEAVSQIQALAKHEQALDTFIRFFEQSTRGIVR
ncbi:acyl-ACP--UDP-N-acetylglucosamine O-acyltransferase [Chitinibacter bivalviorum]|uniref:Acyl-[acyl-carrier-protein]--UDP-N-acetylglucosamine O-acyltransferase n=1 Tax=Chitinibacter bivalviorum TaxID=2739434 RepID=A0A7H9BHS4_9NEIS|nr:acyl-ACP--UDP-N-acetylglucosamine O-acyltransferase [Chitinibacter bivalviorum]QLG87882.1 acyl-ACP--UDP-N-acetylglucosamine O-acyltransferase [Chitinibacter bivalviorum]